MSKPANYYGIGLFVIVAVIIILVIVVTLSSLNWLHRPFYAETYFNESIQGLSVGSPVKLQGVTVGDVSKISFVNKIYPQRQFGRDLGGTVYVQLELDPSDLPVKKNINQLIQRAVKNGLRVRPTSQGVTGSMYLELSFFAKKGSPVPTYSWTPRSPVIPSTPSQFKQITQMVSDISDAFKKAHLQELSQNVSILAKTANNVLNNAQVGKVSKELQTAIGNFNLLAWRVNSALSSNQQMLNNLTQNFSSMSDTLKLMMTQYPSQLIFTSPPSRNMESAR
jgi:phospholipid/cholesterol/gamma-HCH transport system substrate-binding protein